MTQDIVQESLQRRDLEWIEHLTGSTYDEIEQNNRLRNLLSNYGNSTFDYLRTYPNGTSQLSDPCTLKWPDVDLLDIKIECDDEIALNLIARLHIHEWTDPNLEISMNTIPAFVVSFTVGSYSQRINVHLLNVSSHSHLKHMCVVR